MLLDDMLGRKTISTTSLRLYWSVERLLITNGKMSANIRQSDFRDCAPISSPSKKAKKVSQEIAPPERASSSDNEVEDALVDSLAAKKNTIVMSFG